MTTKRERLEQSSTEAATKQKVEFSVGLTAAEHETLERLLKGLCYTGKVTTLENLHIQNILRKMNRNSKTSEGSSSDSSNQQQSRELRQELQSLRKRVNELEDQIEVGDHLV